MVLGRTVDINWASLSKGIWSTGEEPLQPVWLLDLVVLVTGI